MYVQISYQNLDQDSVQILPTVGEFPYSGSLTVELYVDGNYYDKRTYPVTDEPWVQFSFFVSGLSPETTYLFTVQATLNGEYAEAQKTLTTLSEPPPPPAEGTLSVDTKPVKGEIFVDGEPWGMAPQSRKLVPRTYDVTFGDVSGYIKPSPVWATVEAGETASIVGTYSEIGVIQYSLTITALEGGTTDPVPGTYIYYEGATVSVMAYPDEGYYLGYWELDGVDEGNPNPITVVMDTNHSLKCVFTTVPPPPPPPPEKPWRAIFPRLYEIWLRLRQRGIV